MKLYGAERCHKTQHYKTFLKARSLDYAFLDVEQNLKNAKELRKLYANRKLNFPTITIDKKKLKNSSEKELLKWLEKQQVV
nr:glutathione S-transferase N-terminal domain-containing protein [Polaribacter cellanae]